MSTIVVLLLIALGLILVWLGRHPEDDLPSATPAPSDLAGLPPAALEFLQALDDALELPDADRRDIRAELAAHLEDSIAAIEAEGLDEERATREALARLGRPKELAHQLESARRTLPRLLAGAAGGAFQAGVGAVQGYLTGFFMGILVALLALVLTPEIRYVAGHLPAVDQQGLAGGTVGGALICAIAAFVAGRRSVKELIRLSRRPGRQVGPLWALAGFVFLGWILLFNATAEQSWLAVPVELLIPAAFAVAVVYRPDRSLPLIHAQVPGWVVLVSTAGLVVLIVVGAILGSYGWSSGEPDTYATYYSTTVMDFVARPAPAEIANDTGGSIDGSIIDVSWTIHDPDALASYRDIRFEAWRAERLPGAPDWVSDFLPDPNFSTPYATAAPVADNGGLLADFDLRHCRTTRWTIFLTGVGPDGVRYRLGGPESVTSAFSGTIWDWLTSSD